MYRFLQAFEKLNSELDYITKRDLGKIVFKSISERINNLSDKEIRNTNPSAITKLFDICSGYIENTEHSKDLQCLLLTFLINKLLKCEKIEHKIRAIDELLMRMGYTVSIGNRGCGTFENARVKFLESQRDMVVKWILKNDFLDLIFIDYVHPELISRSFPLLELLAERNKLEKEYLEIIWMNARDSHEDTSMATLELLQKLASSLSLS